MARSIQENHCPACKAEPGAQCKRVTGGAPMGEACHLGRMHSGRVKAEDPTGAALVERIDALNRLAVRSALKGLAAKLDRPGVAHPDDTWEHGFEAARQVVLDAIAALGPEKEA